MNWHITENGEDIFFVIAFAACKPFFRLGVDPSSYQQEELLKAIQANTGTFSLVAAEFLESKAVF
jgi:hypothetical protein